MSRGETKSTSHSPKPARVLLRNSGDVAVAAMTARKIARSLGFGETDEFKIGTAVSELATNAVRYGENGVVHVQPVERRAHRGLEVIVEDKGPGIDDMDKALEDHASTTDSLGLGLPSVKRMMDEFTLVSNAGRGTRATIRKWR